MPGAITHLIAGFTLIIIGRYYFKNYFNENNKFKKLISLGFSCIFFSIIPDIFLIIYYITNKFSWLSYCAILPYHNLIHVILFIFGIVALLFIKFLTNIKSKPIWIMGMWALLLHITMDKFLWHNMWL